MLGEANIAHVILVDDEPMVLSALSTLITLETSHAVVVFSQASEALVYLADGRPADVIISDILMPEMDGLTFLMKARALRPDVPQMILSGYAERTAVLADMARSGEAIFLEKPWDNKVLLDNIRIAVTSSETSNAGSRARRNAFA